MSCRWVKGPAVCHVTGSTPSLVHSSPQTPKAAALDGQRVAFELLTKRLVSRTDIRTLLLVFANKTTRPKALNYIPTSWSRDKFLFLVTFLYLALIYCDVPLTVLYIL